MEKPGVIFVGSANVDLVVRTFRFPAPGETLAGTAFKVFAGGKGANQAVAAGKLGGNASLVAKIGEDGFGDQLLVSLGGAGVRTEYILRDSSESTGVALITVNDAGQNTIVVAPGTNALLTPQEISTALGSAKFRVLVAQLEIPLDSVIAASEFAKGRTFILNPAPARALPQELLERVDFLTPNETEAEVLTGVRPIDYQTCAAAAKVLHDQGVRSVIITLGANGSFLSTQKRTEHFPSIQVKPIDTTGAGDCFNGAFAYFLAAGEEVNRAIHLANIAGALSTTRAGAQASVPSLAEVLQFQTRS